MDDEQAYLQPDFDPKSITVPRLRSILVAHNVNYPSSANKGQLVDLFNDNVKPQARKLRANNARVRRTSRGIEDVGSQRGAPAEEDVEPPSTATRSGRRSTRARTEEAQEVAPTPRSTRHSTAPPESVPKRATSKHARAVEKVEEEEEEPEPKRPASRKSRPTAATPIVKTEDADGDSPFSMENVFQTGSSPPPPQPQDRRRTTQSAAKDADRRRSHDVRRRTEDHRPVRQQMDGAVVPTRRTFEMPVSAFKKEEPEPSEEFTPEEQEELVQAQQAGELIPAPRRSKKPATGAPQAVLAILVALLAGFATLWSQEKSKVGYCGEGVPSTEIAGWQIPDWADVLRPQCEAPPPHAEWYSKGFETTCEKGFVLTQHPLSFGGRLPIPPTCEPDSATARKVKAVKERAVEQLRERNAEYECGEAASPEMKERELKESISSKRRKGMSNLEFEELWASAFDEIRDVEEVSLGADGSGHFSLRSNSLARISLRCAIRRSLRETLRQHLWKLIIFFSVASSLLYGQKTLTANRETETRAKQLASLALEKLSTQASLHAQDPDTYRENYVPMAQLRDDVLRDEFRTGKRRLLWEKVQRKVEGNSNVRPMVREGRSGDVGRVWEWVGAVGLLESPQPMSSGAGAGDRRKSGRVSFGGERWIEPRGEGDSQQEMSEVRRWEEGRSYY